MPDFTAVYREYFAGVYRYALALCGDPSLAEEITQETFFRSLAAIDGFRGDCPLSAWLCRVARNCWLDHCRDHRRHSGDVPPEGRAPGAEEAYLRREEARAALAGLDRLPEPYGEVLRLRALGGLSFRDIEAAYGKTETWARVTCFRARQRLKEEME